MRILVVAGLAESLVRFRGPLIRSLVNSKVQVHVAAPRIHEDTATAERLRSWGCHVHSVPMARTGLNPLVDLATLLVLARLCRKVRPTHLLAYTIKPVIYSTLAGWLTGVPFRACLITGVGYAFDSVGSAKRRLIQTVARRLCGLALRRAQVAIFQNPDDRDLFARLGLLSETRAVVVNGSGVPLDEFPKTPVPDGPCTFLLIARLIADKGIREYVAAARLVRERFPEVRFLLVGPLDSNPTAIPENELNGWVKDGVVEYRGFSSQVAVELAQCSVYVLPSYREGTPRSVLEAMAVGRPIITTDAPGCRETVVDGVNGLIVPVKDSVALATACVRLIEDPESVERMGAASRHIAEQRYDVNKVNAHMFAILGMPEVRSHAARSRNQGSRDEAVF